MTAEPAVPSTPEARLREAVLAYIAEIDAGRTPDPAAFLARYPDVADELQQFLSTRPRPDSPLAPPRATSSAYPFVTATGDAPGPYYPLKGGYLPPAPPGYEILGVLGQGGMGVVYRARQVHMNRVVALKVISGGRLADAASRERFRTEAQAVARLDHPNVVRVYDSGEHDGRPYLAMELVPGGTLADAGARRPWPPRAAAELVARLARAMDHAHRQGVIHRDLKPGNVLLSADGTPKVADFGLARHLDEGVGLTLPGDRLGTASYMAPEQADGRTDAVGPATDVYGLGGILYTLLTGRPPHQGGSLTAVLDQARRGEVTPPRRLNPSVPPALERTCLKALAADPANRHASAAALADDLDRYLRRRRRLALATAAAAALLLLGVATWLLAASLGRPPLSAAAVPQPGPAAAPLSGELTVLVWAPDKRGLRVQEWGALPVRNKEQVQLEVRLNQAAHAYLLWIDSEGVVTPLYPWNEGTRITQKKLVAPPVPPPQAVLHSPGEIGHGWKVGGKTGLDTILLLARQTPLPTDVVLADLVGVLPATKYHAPHDWAVRGGDGDESPRTINLGNRAPEVEAEKVDDPLLQLMGRLRPHFEMMRAVRFAHEGD